MSSYNDIINLPHHVSLRHPQMSAISRAAQFSPFAALSGYEAAVQETARLTDSKIELSEEEQAILNSRLQLLDNMGDSNIKVSFTYFQPDQKKAGGSYIMVYGYIKRIDDFERTIILTDGTKIPIDDVVDIQCEAIIWGESC